MKIKANYANEPFWKESNIHSKMPGELKLLDEIAHNLWWVWNYEATELFSKIDGERWRSTEGGDPVLLLKNLPYKRLEEITKDRAFMEDIHKVYAKFRAYMDEPKRTDIPSDTDVDANSEWDRAITAQLYGGDNENRLKQEYLLGIGGIQLLNRLGIRKQIYHCNEGHAALINVQRLVDYIRNANLSFNEAMEMVRASALYTCHTPVPAGHDYFEEPLFNKYMSRFPAKLGISWQDFMDTGRAEPGSNEKFSMSVFALNTSREANGVIYLHGEVSKKMFAPVWKGYFPCEMHVGYVTNGVHIPTWAVSEWRKFYEKHLGKDLYKDQSNPAVREKIYHVEDEEIWDIRKTLKNRLVKYIRESFKDNWLKNQGDPFKVVSILEKINPNALPIGFGRRFATYKRAHLLFTDLERMAKIVNNPAYPVQIIYTGKAHPADGGGQGLIKKIVEISRRPEFLGKIIFLENYDMRLAKRLISGVDIWLNTPTRPLEASGTSGEKAEMNGVLNFSVLDGWWYEGYREGAGWALTEKRTYDDQQFQDELDAATIYSMLENEIIPLYYAKNSKGFSPEWIQHIKNSIAHIVPHYTTRRMFEDYVNRFYSKLARRSSLLSANGFAKAKEIAAWKENVAEHWDSIEVISNQFDENILKGIEIGDTVRASIVLDKHAVKGDLGVEVVRVHSEPASESETVKTYKMHLDKTEGSKACYSFELKASEAGLSNSACVFIRTTAIYRTGWILLMLSGLIFSRFIFISISFESWCRHESRKTGGKKYL